VSAVNDIGEGSKSELTLLAASVPSKPNAPALIESLSTSIEIKAAEPSFNGGDAVATYAFKRDDGPMTLF
jgi:hypothetical protein